jgi:hypothetical protein
VRLSKRRSETLQSRRRTSEAAVAVTAVVVLSAPLVAATAVGNAASLATVSTTRGRDALAGRRDRADADAAAARCLAGVEKEVEEADAKAGRRREGSFGEEEDWTIGLFARGLEVPICLDFRW